MLIAEFSVEMTSNYLS